MLVYAVLAKIPYGFTDCDEGWMSRTVGVIATMRKHHNQEATSLAAFVAFV
jgi:hypothetical protein